MKMGNLVRRVRTYQWDDGDHRWLWLLAVNSMIYMASAAFSPYLTLYYKQNGISSLEIGTLMAVGPVVSICIQPLWGVFSDLTGRRKLTLAIVVLGTAATVLGYRFGSGFGFFLVMAILLASFNTSIVPLSDALTLEYANRHSINYARIRIGGTVGYSIVVLAVGGFLKEDPGMAFLLGAAGYVLLFFLVLKIPVEGSSVRHRQKQKKAEASDPGKKKGKIFYDNSYLFVMVCAFVMQVGMNFNSNFMGVYIGEMGYDQGLIGVANFVSAASEIPILLAAGWIMKRFSSIQILLFSCVMMSVRIFLLTGESVGFVVASQLLQSVTYMTMYYSCVMFISRNTYPDKRSQGQSMLAMVQGGFASVAGSMLGGVVTEQLGSRGAYWLMAAAVMAMTAAVAAAYRFYRKKQQPAARSGAAG